jgi:hypothetical protein
MLYDPIPVAVLDPACPVLFEDLACILATCDLKVTLAVSRIAERMRSNPFFKNKPDKGLNGKLTTMRPLQSYHEPRESQHPPVGVESTMTLA